MEEGVQDLALSRGLSFSDPISITAKVTVSRLVNIPHCDLFMMWKKNFKKGLELTAGWLDNISENVLSHIHGVRNPMINRNVDVQIA